MHLRIKMRLQRVDQSNETTDRLEGFARWILQVGECKVQEIPISKDVEPNWTKIPHEFLTQNDEDGFAKFNCSSLS